MEKQLYITSHEYFTNATIRQLYTIFTAYEELQRQFELNFRITMSSACATYKKLWLRSLREAQKLSIDASKRQRTISSGLQFTEMLKRRFVETDDAFSSDLSVDYRNGCDSLQQ